MNKYTELRDKHQKQVNDFPMMFAFNEKQFEERKQKRIIYNRCPMKSR